MTKFKVTGRKGVPISVERKSELGKPVPAKWQKRRPEMKTVNKQYQLRSGWCDRVGVFLVELDFSSDGG